LKKRSPLSENHPSISRTLRKKTTPQRKRNFKKDEEIFEVLAENIEKIFDANEEERKASSESNRDEVRNSSKLISINSDQIKKLNIKNLRNNKDYISFKDTRNNIQSSPNNKKNFKYNPENKGRQNFHLKIFILLFDEENILFREYLNMPNN